MDTAGEGPFWVWSCFHDPHPPCLASEPWASIYDPDDLEIGALLEGEMDALPPHFALTQREKPDFSSYRENGFGVHGLHSHLVSEKLLRRDMAIYHGTVSL